MTEAKAVDEQITSLVSASDDSESGPVVCLGKDAVGRRSAKVTRIQAADSVGLFPWLERHLHLTFSATIARTKHSDG